MSAHHMTGNSTAHLAMNKFPVQVYDSTGYDRAYLSAAAENMQIDLTFHDFSLRASTADSARSSSAVCVFVNDAVDRECLVKLASLGIRLVALRCAGYNNVDCRAAQELGISVVRVPAYSPHAVAEHAIALLLTLNRKIHRAHNRVREQNFSLDGLVGFDVYGKTIGVVGTGRIGRVAAEIFRGFGCTVVAHDVVPDAAWADREKIRYVSLHELLGISDVVSLHLPLTQQTKHLIDTTTINLMKRGAFLVNTSRGKLIDTTALISALKSGHLGGVALDVYEEEEDIFFKDLSGSVLQDDELARLLSFPNVLVTAHQAFLTHEALTEIARVTIENMCRFRDGQPLHSECIVA